MPDPDLVATYERLLEAHRRAAADLVPVLEELALATIREVLPDADRLQVHGEFNEDWIRTLRIQRIVDDDGTVLFDGALGHPDEQVHAMIDEVGVEYLDVLLDLTGDEYMGWHEVVGRT
jgi:hypothetical protein